MQFTPCSKLLIYLTLLAPLRSAAQAPPVPEYYGVFLWDGQTLRELAEQERPQAGMFRPPIRLSDVKTSNPRPSFVVFRRELRGTGPGPVKVMPVKHVIQVIRSALGNALCDPVDFWDTDDTAAIAARAAPADSNPEMVRIVLVGDLAPGWYALSIGTSEFTFGVQLEAFSPSTALVESLRELGEAQQKLFPVGTFLSHNPAAARGSDWKCRSRPPGAEPGRTAGGARVERQSAPSTAPAPGIGTQAQEARRAEEVLPSKYPDARAYRVRHDHGTGALARDEEHWRFCEGVLYIFADRVKYEVNFTRDGEKHDFEYPLQEIKEVRPNRWPMVSYRGFHIRLKSGLNYNFAYPGLDPAQVLTAFPQTLR